MAKNKRLIPGKLYQLKDFFFVFDSLDVNVSPQVSSVTGEHRLNKNDIIMVIEVIEGKTNDYPFAAQVVIGKAVQLKGKNK